MDHNKAIALLSKRFEANGARVLKPKHRNANGPDLTIIKNDSAYRIEVKILYKIRSGSMQTGPIEEARRNDDFVAIVFPNGFVFIEPMDEFLKLANLDGRRTFTFLNQLVE